MRYSKLLLVALYGFGLILIGTFLSKGPTALTDKSTIAAEVLYLATLAAILLVVPRRSAALDLLLATLVIVFFLSSFLGYQLFPDGFPFGGGHTRTTLNPSLVTASTLFLWAGTIALVAGIRTGTLPFRSEPRTSEPWFCPPWQYLTVAALAVSYEVVISLRYQAHTTIITADRQGTFLQRLVHTDAVILIGCILAIAHWRRFTQLGRVAMGTALVAGVLYRTVSGSRAAIFTVLVTLLIIVLEVRGDFRIPPRKLLWIVFACLSSILAFPPATFARVYWDISAQFGRSPSLREISEYFRAWNSHTSALLTLPYSVFYRLSGMDPLATIVKGDAVDLQKYVSLRNDVQSFINVAVPGTPFPDALEPAKTFLIIYRDYPLEYLKHQYVTTMWTMWGDAIAHFGFVGGVASMFVMGVLLSMGMQIIRRWRSQYGLSCAFGGSARCTTPSAVSASIPSPRRACTCSSRW